MTAAVADTDATLRISIDAGVTGAPVSKYIYGQFIEHLGRCIYGGIWAEMLEDRKFYHPVGAKESPWHAVGETTRISMDPNDSFVGDHTPKISLAGDGVAVGIVQNELGLIQGTTYIGRIWLAGDVGVGPVRVSLVWGDAPGQRQTVSVAGISKSYAVTPLRFTAGARTDKGRLEITAGGTGAFHVGTVSLMPGDSVNGMRSDTLALLKELNAPVYRWPGGNFVSGYNWKDGIGNRDRRPPRKNPAWKGIEHNDFGIDEFMAFCRVVVAEPYIAVNSGLGDVKGAVEELQYANGAADTPMGQHRSGNGHPRPYRVKWWGIGNEMYGNWQLGHMPLEKYIEKNNRFAAAMRAQDPAIKLVAVGATGPWSEGMMQHGADHMDLISEHFYCREKPNLVAHVLQIPRNIRHKAEAHRDYRRRFGSLKGKDIRIALDEWNYWYGAHVYGDLGTRYFLKDALGIAAGLNEYIRQSDIMFMANYAQTVNVIGCIKTTKTAAAFAATGLPLKLYRAQFGTIPVKVTVPKPLDVAAAWTADRKALTIAIVNPTMKPLDIPLDIQGANLAGTGRRWQIAGTDPQAYNEPGKPPRVKIEQSPLTGVNDRLAVVPCSVTLYRLEAAEEGRSTKGKTTPMKLTVAAAQIAVTRDIAANVDTIGRAIDRASAGGADILLTPEGSVSGYTHQFDRAAAAAAVDQLVGKARSHNLALALGTCYIEPDDGRCYNQIRFYDKRGTFLGFHSKTLRCGTMEEPSKGELHHFAAQRLRIFQIEGITVGGLICNDMWANPMCTPMPDPHLSQQLSRMGARIIFHAINGGRDGGDWSREVYWPFHETNLRMRARAGHMWIVSADNCQPTNIPCSAPSGVLRPDGCWAAKAPNQGECVVIHSIVLE